MTLLAPLAHQMVCTYMLAPTLSQDMKLLMPGMSSKKYTDVCMHFTATIMQPSSNSAEFTIFLQFPQVVSDLQRQWLLLFVDDTRIRRCCIATRAYAVRLIKEVLRQSRGQSSWQQQ